MNLYIPGRTIAEAVEHFRRPGQRTPDIRLCTLARHDELLLQMARALAAAATAGAPELYAATSAQWISVHLLAADESWATRIDRETHTPRLSRMRLAEVLDLMRSDYAEPLTLTQLASEARVSKFHFSRVFRAATGTSPHAYLVQLRLDAATVLLTETDLGIAQISTRCGFTRPSHFGVSFSRRFAMSPSEYRHRNRPTPAG